MKERHAAELEKVDVLLALISFILHQLLNGGNDDVDEPMIHNYQAAQAEAASQSSVAANAGKKLSRAAKRRVWSLLIFVLLLQAKLKAEEEARELQIAKDMEGGPDEREVETTKLTVKVSSQGKRIAQVLSLLSCRHLMFRKDSI